MSRRSPKDRKTAQQGHAVAALFGTIIAIAHAEGARLDHAQHTLHRS
jgi:hypothetical protein